MYDEIVMLDEVLDTGKELKEKLKEMQRKICFMEEVVPGDFEKQKEILKDFSVVLQESLRLISILEKAQKTNWRFCGVRPWELKRVQMEFSKCQNIFDQNENWFCQVIDDAAIQLIRKYLRYFIRINDQYSSVWQELQKQQDMRDDAGPPGSLIEVENSGARHRHSLGISQIGRYLQSALKLSDEVRFRAAAPNGIQKDTYFEVRVMMFNVDEEERADKEMEELGKDVKSYTTGIWPVGKRQRIKIILQSQDVAFEERIAEMVWNGKYAMCSFEAYLPPQFEKKQIRIKGRVYVESVLLTDLRLILDVDPKPMQKQIMEKCLFRSAFLSYASADRAEVAARIQGMLSVRPDMDYFFDSVSLRRGEHWEERIYSEIDNKDILMLFWSRSAAASEWVEKEWTYAYEKKGIEAIEPMPLEPPEKCPPPEKLRELHFGDWTLCYTEALRLKRGTDAARQ